MGSGRLGRARLAGAWTRSVEQQKLLQAVTWTRPSWGFAPAACLHPDWVVDSS
jgi:hypothetical protein